MGAQVDRPDRARRARGLVPRAHDRRALDHRASPRSGRAFEPLVPGVRFATPDDARRRRRSRHRGDHARAGPGRGRRAPAPRRDARRGARRSPTSTARCSSSTRCRPVSAARARSSPGEQLGVQPDAVTLAKGLANGLPIGALLVSDDAPTRLRAGRPRVHLRRQPRLVRGGVRGRRHDRRRAARHVPRASARASPGSRVRRGARRAASCSRVELDRPAGPVVDAALEHGLLVGTAGETHPAAHTAAHDHGGGGRPGTRHPRGGSRMTTKFERQGTILRLVQQRQLSTQAELAEALRAEGIDAVQATVSRDIAQLGLVKVRNARRQADLRAAGRGRPAPARRARRRRSRRWAGAMTRPAAARRSRRRAGSRSRSPTRSTRRASREVAGTIAGDNTIFVAARERHRRGAELADELHAPRSGGRAPS